MTKPLDDLEAVRSIANALDGFSGEDQERILRWVRERVGLPMPRNQQTIQTPSSSGSVLQSAIATQQATTSDIKGFVEQKKPISDAQFSSVVAYFFRFVASAENRKDEITAADLIEACRLAQWKRFKKPAQTLHNTVKLGYLDKGKDRGSFRINSVGENLVAMSLPGSEVKTRSVSKTRSKKKTKKVR